jgi:hypothetical protein
MRALSFLIVLAISVPAKAQWITFEQTYGGSLHDEAKSVATAPDCGYAVVGYTSSFGTGFYDFYLVRTDPLGDTLWTRTYGGVDREVAFWVEPTTNGGFVMAGYTESYGAGGNDFYLVKVDSNGDTVWTRTYGGSGTETARCVKQTNDGGYVVAGFSNSFGAGHFDFYLVRTDSNGIALWDTTYGGGEWDEAYCIVQTEDGGFVLAGRTASFGAGQEDFWLVRTDSLGGVAWSRTFGGSFSEICRCVYQTANGGFLLSGYVMYTTTNRDVFAVKTDSAGYAEWDTTYGGGGNDVSYGGFQTPDGGFAFAGYTDSFGAGEQDFFLLRTDSLGVPQWTRTFGGADNENAFCVRQTPDSGYVLAGYSISFGPGGYDYYLVKTDPDGLVSVVEGATPALPTALSITAAPNPFNPTTCISFSLAEASNIRLDVFDLLGRKIAMLQDEPMSVGEYEVIWDASGLPSGVYLVRLSAGEHAATEKVVLLK